MNARRPLRLGIWAACLLAPAAAALDIDRSKPVQVQADRIELNQRSGIGRYTGNVRLTQGTLKIGAAEVEMRHRGSQLEAISAQGKPVRFQYRPEGEEQDVRGSAARIDYSVEYRTLRLSGGASIERTSDRLSAEILTLHLDDNSLEAEGKDDSSRVEMTVLPKTTAADPSSPSGGPAATGRPKP